MVEESYVRPSRPSLARIGIPDEADELAVQLHEERHAQLSREGVQFEASSSSSVSVAASETKRIMMPAPMMSFSIATIDNTMHDLLHVGAGFDEGRGAYAGELDILG